MPDGDDCRTSIHVLEERIRSIEQYSEAQIAALVEQVDLRFENIKESTAREVVTMSARLELLNEFRNSMKDQAATYLTRATFEARMEALMQKIEALETYRNRSEGKSAAMSAVISITIGVVVTLINILMRFVTKP